MPGCPIRKSADQRPFAPTRGLSQLVTSFIACESLGIRHTPFTTFARTELADARRIRGEGLGIRVCYNHYSLFFYSLFQFAQQILLIILSALSFLPHHIMSFTLYIVHCKLYITWRGDSLYILLSLTICQRTATFTISSFTIYHLNVQWSIFNVQCLEWRITDSNR